jgi:hypothetical protein
MWTGSGQINRGSFFGDKVYEMSLIKEFKNFVEVGTWNGEGSTKCFMDGISARNDGASLYSIEANIEFYKHACNFWQSFLNTQDKNSPKLNLIYGRVISEISDLISVEEIVSHSRFKDSPWLDWRERNSQEYSACENIVHLLPDEIDVLLLDGGQFSTQAEWERLRDRTKVIMLDDTTTFKTEKIRNEIISDKNKWKVVIDYTNDRNGIFIGSRCEYSHLINAEADW